MGIKIKNIKSDISNIIEAIRLVYKSGRSNFVIRIGLIILQSILPIASLYLIKLLIDGISVSYAQRDFIFDSRVLLYAALFSAVFLLLRANNIFTQLNDDISIQKLIDYITKLIHSKSTELDLACYDNPDYYDNFHRAKEESNYRPVQILNNLTGVIINLLSLFGVILILFSFSWVAVIIIFIAGMPSFYIKIQKSGILYRWRTKNTSIFRMADYLSNLMTNRIFAKEIRVFNLGKYFQKQFNYIRKKIVKQILKISVKRAKLDFYTIIIETTALLIIIILLINKTYSGVITIGSFVMFFEAFRRGQGYLQGIVSGFSGIHENKLFLNNLFDFLKLKPSVTSPQNPEQIPAKIKKGIKFENVSFRYPDSDRLIIENISFEVKPGEILLVRGRNGTGKTTLIKLLCRLYDCTQGAIYFEGIDIKRFSLSEFREKIGVIFQDFAMYDFSVRENIALGNITEKDNTDKIEQVSRLSCSEPVVDNLPHKYETILGKYFKDGEELSMGQWQRIAIARALFNNSQILVLDEPANWLDDEAKNIFYRNLLQIKEDRIILLISHSVNDIPESEKFYSINDKENFKKIILN